MPCDKCKKNDVMTIAMDSVAYYLILELRTRMLTTDNPSLLFDQTQKWMKTVIFAGGTYGFDSAVPAYIYDWFISVGKMFENSMACSYCIARNLFLTLCALLYERYESGMFSWSTDMWLMLDEFLRLSVGDIATEWITPSLRLKGYNVTSGDVRGYSNR